LNNTKMISADKMIVNPYKKTLQERQAKGKQALSKQLEVKAREMEGMALAAREMTDLACVHGNRNTGTSKKSPSARRVPSGASPPLAAVSHVPCSPFI
jgi:hypothetical protein